MASAAGSAASTQHWSDHLREYATEHALSSSAAFDAEHDLERRLKVIFSERAAKEAQKHPTLGAIPRFYRRPYKADPVRLKVRKLARMRFMQRKSAELLDEDELERLAVLLTENTSPPDDGKEAINWDQFGI